MSMYWVGFVVGCMCASAGFVMERVPLLGISLFVGGIFIAMAFGVEP